MAEKRKEARADLAVNFDDIKLPQDLQRLRVDQEKLKQLIKSIKRVGLISPIVVQKVGKRYILVAGYRRYLAIKELGWKSVDAKVLLREKDFVDEITLDENFIREDINPIEEAIWLKNVQRKEGLTGVQMAQKIGKSRSFVKERLLLLDMDDVLIEAVAGGEMGIRMAREISAAKDATERQVIAKQVLENGATLKVVQYWVADANLRELAPKAPDLDEENIPAVEHKYVEPMFLCDVCGNEVGLAESKFVRTCERCFNIARENLRPATDEKNVNEE